MNSEEDNHANLIASRKQGTKHINISYLVFLFATIGIGIFQFGYGLGQWNGINDAYSSYHNWGDDADSKQTIVTSVTVAGTAVGALGSGPVA